MKVFCFLVKFSRFLDISVSLVNARISDHSPIIVHLSLVEKGPKPFDLDPFETKKGL
jgi:hypothetical protein